MGVIDKVTNKVPASLPWNSDRREQHEVPPVGAEVLALPRRSRSLVERVSEEPWSLPGIGELSLDARA